VASAAAEPEGPPRKTGTGVHGGRHTSLQPFSRDVERQRLFKPPWFTPTELARSVRNTEIAALAEQFVAAYQELRFGGKVDAAPRLFILLEELKTPRMIALVIW
jgi:hypothetical protein